MADKTLKEALQTMLNSVPNSVSGDGKTFVAALKKFLATFKNDTSDVVEGISECKGQVTGITLTEIDASSTVYNILVNFDGSSVGGYSGAQIWVKKDNGSYAQVGTTTGSAYTIENVAKGSTYYVKVLALNTYGGSSNFSEATETSITIHGVDIVPGTPKQFVVTWDENGKPKWEWLYEKDEYTDFFELRLDQNPGVYDSNYLARTRDLTSDAVPAVRSGTAYLYVRNIFGTYGTPATNVFAKEQPSKPTAPTFTKIIKGVQIGMTTLPVNCSGYKLVIDETDTYETAETPFTLFRTTGSLTVKYCFIDKLGDGEYSDEITVDLATLVTSDDLAANAVTEEKIAANAVTADKIKAGSVITEKLAAGAVTAANIASKAITTDKLDAASVTGDKISAGAITTEKLAAATITLSDVLKIVGGAVSLSSNGLKCSLANGSYALFNSNGLSYYDSNNIAYAAIGRFLIGQANNGAHVKFNAAWDITPSVVCNPVILQTNVTNYNNYETEIVCRARDVSKSGFYIDAYTRLKAGASGSTTINQVMVQKSAKAGWTVSGSYTFIVPSNATALTAVISTAMSGENYSYDIYIPPSGSEIAVYPGASGHYETIHCEATIKVTLNLYINGSLAATRTYGPTNGSFSNDDSFYCTFAAGSSVRIDAILTATNVENGSANGTVTAKQVTFNTTSDTVIATGAAQFIVTDLNNAQFTIS